MYKQDARCNVMVVDVPLHIPRLEVKANNKNVDHNAIDKQMIHVEYQVKSQRQVKKRETMVPNS